MGIRLWMLALALPCPDPVDITTETVRVIRRETQGSTQGLVFREGALFESTGEYGQSVLNRIDVATGRVTQLARLPEAYFGEGLEFWDGKFLQLTWRENVALLWGEGFSSPPREMRYAWEGWGVTHDETHWIASDGTDTIRFLDRHDLSEKRAIRVREGALPRDQLNELEWIDGKIFANVFQSGEVLRIDPASGCVDGKIDVSGLAPGIANGLAYDPAGGVLYVTGKNWAEIFELKMRD